VEALELFDSFFSHSARRKSVKTMCQIVSANRSDVKDLTTSLLPTREVMRRPSFAHNSKDIQLCPVMGKLALPPNGLDNKTTSGSSLPAIPFLAQEEKHSCTVCIHFVEDGSTGSSFPTSNNEVTFSSVFT
jgi:hypothetical protein